MVCNNKRKPVFIKRKWNHVIFSRATVLAFHPVHVMYLYLWWKTTLAPKYSQFKENIDYGCFPNIQGRTERNYFKEITCRSFLGNKGSIPGRVIPKTKKIVVDTFLLNTQHCKVCIKGKIEQSRERSSALPYTSV